MNYAQLIGKIIPDWVAVLAGKSPTNTADVLTTDGAGALRVNLTNGGAGGTSAVDDSAYSAGVSSGTPLMAWDPTSGQLQIAQFAAGTRKLAISGTFSSTPASSSTASAAAQVTQGTTAAQLLAANALRVGLIVQNTGTTKIYLVLGAGTPTAAANHIELPACGSANDGSSPAWYGPPGLTWLGAIQAISSGAGGTLTVTEFT